MIRPGSAAGLWVFYNTGNKGAATFCRYALIFKALAYVLSVIPALWAFFLVPGPGGAALIFLITGFIGLIGIDWLFWTQGLAPRWWMRLRLLLTGGVVLCLAVGLAA